MVFMLLILAAPRRAGKSRRGAGAVLRVCGDRNGTAWRCAPCLKAQPPWPRRRGIPTAWSSSHCGNYAAVAAKGGVVVHMGLAGFKPAVTKVQSCVANGSQRLRVGAAHRRACAALTNTMYSAVCAVDAALMDLADAALGAP